ncbi:MAG: starch synthase [Candidatus Muproteobacteria bacterium RBG_16_65_34]|uniref:Glycogen synthase n=1 Tax=Candidatus Muproteobacteria bacterium RBG_16_65_34 TaxID=1817760 RepID=A0A1F6TLJ8_9PROT|nr:MAG: starch synthase [Candidatus Muproteobacteria bacterium RBG_16_65_34]
MPKVLFVTSEAHPLMKTGGLGDVCGSLPAALKGLGVDARLLLPGYHDAIRRAGKLRAVAQITIPPLAQPVTLLETVLPGTRVPVWLVDFPPAYDRPGNPYLNGYGHPWHDNAARFALLARAAVAVALDKAGLDWRPDIVHAHDWQTGLAPALLAREPERPATLFTIHNFAYQGLFPRDTLAALGLPEAFWSHEALEFHGDLAFIKGGLVYADRITTVSPTYAREIQTPEFGHGLDGLLRHRAEKLLGILNGIDDNAWNPARDPHIAARYSAKNFRPKQKNKTALQKEFGLPADARIPLIGLVGRLAHQKGVDLLLEALPRLMKLSVQLVLLGTGEAGYEKAIRDAAAQYRGRLAARIDYDEATAHRVEAGADMFLMPSRFEPCGLNQLYSLRYGTVPIVRRVGGLADTVVNATPEALKAGRATGVSFAEARPETLVAAVRRALALHRDPKVWRRIAATGMGQDFSWRHSAAEYLKLYDELIHSGSPRAGGSDGRSAKGSRGKRAR